PPESTIVNSNGSIFRGDNCNFSGNVTENVSGISAVTLYTNNVVWTNIVSPDAAAWSVNFNSFTSFSNGTYIFSTVSENTVGLTTSNAITFDIANMARDLRRMIAGPNPLDRSVNQLEIRYVTRETQAKIYDVNGRLIRSLKEPEVFQNSGRIIWDLTDAKAKRVAPGLYLIHIFDDSLKSRKLLKIIIE
ncbi:MAG TPA: T9SS type A sorting domain-containing protein, partial [Spirochaetota bacterium]|nr:T9SS type A sorting domain-containing protein [Spirochaetota bacterium]